MNSVLNVERLSATYGKRQALDNISFEVHQGSIFGVLGPNGSGKSTLLKALLGLINRPTGTVAFFGGTLAEHRRRVGYMPQAAEVEWQFPITVKKVVLMGTYAELGWLRRPGKAAKDKAERAMEITGITDLRDRHIAELSGGQKQRVFLARLLAQDPDLLLMDEPFSGVDVASQRVIMDVMRRLTAEGKTIVLVHHNLSEAAELCDAGILLAGGTARCVGPIEKVLSQDNLAEVFDVPINGAGSRGVAKETAAVEGER